MALRCHLLHVRENYNVIVFAIVKIIIILLYRKDKRVFLARRVPWRFSIDVHGYNQWASTTQIVIVIGLFITRGALVIRVHIHIFCPKR